LSGYLLAKQKEDGFSFIKNKPSIDRGIWILAKCQRIKKHIHFGTYPGSIQNDKGIANSKEALLVKQEKNLAQT